MDDFSTSRFRLKVKAYRTRWKVRTIIHKRHKTSQPK